MAEPAARRDGILLLDLNAKLLSAAIEPGNRITFEYSSDSRAIARFDRRPARMNVDGDPAPTDCANAGECAVLLPRGRHSVTLATAAN